MSNCAVVGVNWGDEGKGRMVDLLTENYEVVVRFQGGGNAGHTVENEFGKFALHLLPSGIFREGVMNILGNGVALDPENLVHEIEDVRARGVLISPGNLMISDRSSLLLPWHRDLDDLEELRLKDKKYGSTKQGIAPFCYEVTSCQAIYEITFLFVSTLNAWAEPQVQQSPALATLLFVDWLPTGQWSAVNLAVYFRESRYFYFVNIERSQMIRT